MLIAWLPSLVFVVGVLLHALGKHATVVEVARAMIWTGLLVTLMGLAHHVVKLG